MIHSDKWIRAQCEKPTHIVLKNDGAIEYASVPFTQFQKDIDSANDVFSELNIGGEIPLIRPITEEELSNWKPMISPYVNENVREENGKKIISYGVSSGGYDVRLAPTFKLFTNINSGIIDPLNMPTDCYVDIEGEYCIIPPNSYLLGHTVEYFNIPKDVEVVCVGKCLAGDTLITIPETGEIKRMDSTNGIKTIQGVDNENKKISVYPTEGLICNGVLPMVEVNTLKGYSLTATPSHPLRTWNGWKPISELKAGSRIAIAREERIFGNNDISESEARLLAYMLADGQCSVNGSSPVFTKTDTVVMSDFIKNAEIFGFTVSKKDNISVRLVNKVGRGGIAEKNKANIWLESHGVNKLSKEKTIPVSIQTAKLQGLKSFISALFTCDGSFMKTKNGVNVCLEYYSTSKILVKQLQILLRRFGIFMSFHQSTKFLYKTPHTLYTLRTTSIETVQKFNLAIGFVKDSEKYNEINEWCNKEYRSQKSNWDTLPYEAWETIDSIFNRLNITYSSVGLHPNKKQSISLLKLKLIAEKLNDKELLSIVNSDVIWDTICSIVPVNSQLAYDYTVPEVHNFIANGIVVHNSTYARAGVLINVTPIEPGFSGQVVIEVSNCTNLPVKVYANQGISQFLFFQMDEKCSVSYADRNGKYQGQTGITTAKV